MNFKYLCATHRQQLQANPTQALRVWSESYENGLVLLAMNRKYDAIAHLGCAFESAEIVLSANVIEVFDSITLVVSSAATLARLLKDLGKLSESTKIIDLTTARLDREATCFPELGAYIKSEIKSVHNFVNDVARCEYPLEDKYLIVSRNIESNAVSLIH